MAAGQEELFDATAEYEQMLQRGISLSGEDYRFFIEGRLKDLRAHLPAGFSPERILDFGCGLGHTTSRLAATFPQAELLGFDTSAPAVNAARGEYGSERISFTHHTDFGTHGAFDLCYVNGVFHHIVPEKRLGALAIIRDALRTGGYLALFENNPWNPGTRMVMRRIPFDRDAITLTPPEAKGLVREAGFTPAPPRFLFYFPRALRLLRFSEPLFARVPLGAQYYLLARK